MMDSVHPRCFSHAGEALINPDSIIDPVLKRSVPPKIQKQRDILLLVPCRFEPNRCICSFRYLYRSQKIQMVQCRHIGR